MAATVNRAKFSEMVGKSERTVTRWIKEEGMPASGTGRKGSQLKIPLPDALLWWLEFEIKQRFGEQGPKLDHESEKIRLTKARADKTEVEKQQLSKELLPVDEVQDFIYNIAVIYGTQLDALGGRLANELAGISEPGQIRQKIFEEGRAIRSSTAEKLNQYADSLGAYQRGGGQRTAAKKS